MKTRTLCFAAASLAAAVCIPAAHAGEAEDLRSLHDTTVKLLDLLVQQGVITRDKADALIEQSQQDTAGKTSTDNNTPAPAPAANVSSPATTPSPPAPAKPEGSDGTASQPTPTPEKPASPSTVRVPYVPEIVKEQIRDEIKKEVLDQARNERWGEPGALPDWIGRISWAGDFRLREETDLFPSNNGVPNADPANLQFVNGILLYNDKDTRNRLRILARFGLEARVSDEINAGLRLASGATGNGSIPVSENTTLGNYDARTSIGIDRAYIRYKPLPWITLTGGRFANPFFAPTTMVWAETLSPEGVVGKFSHEFSNDLTGLLIAGAFPIQQQDNEVVSLGTSPQSKWMFGYQTGFDWQFQERDNWKAAVALYDYRHVEGILDPNPGLIPNSTTYDWTVAGFRQFGNQVFDIHGLYDQSQGSNVDPSKYLWGLLSKFRELNFSTSLDLVNFAPLHIIVDADYVKNLAFHYDEIVNRTGAPTLVTVKNQDGSTSIIPNPALINRTVGYQTRLKVGARNIGERGDWQAFIGYRYVERDAVIDAFTDADFHLGGTDTRGPFIGVRYGIAHNAYVGARWFSGDQIDSLPLAIDVLQVDFNVSF
jgi:hypothetical protein